MKMKQGGDKDYAAAARVASKHQASDFKIAKGMALPYTHSRGRTPSTELRYPLDKLKVGDCILVPVSSRLQHRAKQVFKVIVAGYCRRHGQTLGHRYATRTITIRREEHIGIWRVK